jgi:uncharacterized membrane protein (UPF0127 family)
MRVVKVIDETRGTVIGESVEVAETSITRMVGLLGRTGIDAGGGLWIKPSSGVHTIGMKFSIDVIGLDKNRRVIKLWQDLVPYRITSVHGKLRSVVELSAGRIAECKVQLGDVLNIDEKNT